MKINSTPAETIRTEHIQGTRSTVGAEGGVQATQPVAPVTRTDRVQISDAGRAMAAQMGEAQEAGALDPARAAEIRQRILTGAYNSVDMASDVARNILGSGDL